MLKCATQSGTGRTDVGHVERVVHLESEDGKVARSSCWMVMRALSTEYSGNQVSIRGCV